jgi:hypothetical protein
MNQRIRCLFGVDFVNSNNLLTDPLFSVNKRNGINTNHFLPVVLMPVIKHITLRFANYQLFYGNTSSQL